jgi:hypothetical protein
MKVIRRLLSAGLERKQSCAPVFASFSTKWARTPVIIFAVLVPHVGVFTIIFTEAKPGDTVPRRVFPAAFFVLAGQDARARDRPQCGAREEVHGGVAAGHVLGGLRACLAHLVRRLLFCLLF